jgi:hypothetical protein
MTIDWDKLISFLPYLISVVSLVFALRRQKHEEANTDADTIKTFADTTATVGKQYKDLLEDFNTYKAVTAQQLSVLEGKLALVISENDVMKEDNRILKADNMRLKKDNEALVKTNGALTRWVERLCKQLKSADIIPTTCEDLE